MSLVLSSYCDGSSPDVPWAMTHEKRPEVESDKSQPVAKSGNLRERVEALQEKVSTLNEALDDAQQTLREASDGSGSVGNRGGSA